MLIFYSLRARMSLKHLSIQLFDDAGFLPAVSKDILKCNGHYRPLFLDLRNEIPDHLRIRSGVFGFHKKLAFYCQK